MQRKSRGAPQHVLITVAADPANGADGVAIPDMEAAAEVDLESSVHVQMASTAVWVPIPFILLISICVASPA